MLGSNAFSARIPIRTRRLFRQSCLLQAFPQCAPPFGVAIAFIDHETSGRKAGVYGDGFFRQPARLARTPKRDQSGGPVKTRATALEDQPSEGFESLLIAIKSIQSDAAFLDAPDRQEGIECLCLIDQRKRAQGSTA